MGGDTANKRVDCASRVVCASPAAVYRAFIDPIAMISWLPPKGMTGEVHEFDARAGGAYRLRLSYTEANPAIPGKTSEHADAVEGYFQELVSNERIVQVAQFSSSDPAFAGAMTVTWTLKPVAVGTQVTVRCENVPAGISPEDHQAGLQSTLENLAAFVA